MLNLALEALDLGAQPVDLVLRQVVALVDVDLVDAPGGRPGATGDGNNGGARRVGAAIGSKGARLIVRSGRADKALEKLVRETGASRVSWSRCYEPARVERDAEIEKALHADGLEAACAELAAAGKFRADLLHRLDLFRVRLPPLRQRGADIVVEVGGSGTLDKSIAAARLGGNVALIGVLIFWISFVVIVRLWAVHHRLFGTVVGLTVFDIMGIALGIIFLSLTVLA